MAPSVGFMALGRALKQLRAVGLTRCPRESCSRCMRTYSAAAKEWRPDLGWRRTANIMHQRQQQRSSLHNARGMATVLHSNPDMWGPLNEYDKRVRDGKLRDDDHQRTIVQSLQDLHDMLTDYHAPRVAHPSIESLKPPSHSIIGSLFYRKPAKKRTVLPPNLPKGLYMFGDVGSGKTMLMDMFYDTLPHNITSKTRIHFHNFMQDVHKSLHLMKVQHGTDLDAVQYVAADIAEKGSVLCFDEFQCTDVADAMILRR